MFPAAESLTKTTEDEAELTRRAMAAKERLRAGLYAGPAVDADEALYPAPRKKKQSKKTRAKKT